MRIAIPTNSREGLEGFVAEHFGRCKTYTIIDEKGEILEIVDNESEHGGGVGLPPDFLKKQGVDALICWGIGMRAIRLCNSLGIIVYICEPGKVGGVVEKFVKGGLRIAGKGDACDH